MGKEMADVTGKLKLCRPFFFIVVLLMAIVVFSPGVSYADPDVDSQCSGQLSRWEKVMQDLKDKVHGYSSVQSTPVERVVQRPIVSNLPGRTIARQISDALQVKDELLNSKRIECRNLLNLENQLFNELQECAQNARSSKNKDFSNLAKKRRAFVDKVGVSIAEVKEVEGQETVLPYEAAYQDPYRRSVNNYWENYQQMYRRWWGR